MKLIWAVLSARATTGTHEQTGHVLQTVPELLAVIAPSGNGAGMYFEWYRCAV